ncbi:MAG: hypothetical protein NTW32_14480 [Chloroflexi bacterium]|nr:hypothetical protein [Chloroflexota bacterium]
MKKSVFVTVIILALLASMLPLGSALAKEPGNSNVNVRNKSGGVVTVILTNANGSQTLTLAEGVYDISLPATTFSYYAITPCGNQVGTFNLTNHRQMFFFCNNGPEIKLQNLVPPEPVCLVSGFLNPHRHFFGRPQLTCFL